jgi:hypothetical protein
MGRCAFRTDIKPLGPKCRLRNLPAPLIITGFKVDQSLQQALFEALELLFYRLFGIIKIISDQFKILLECFC